MSWPSNRGRVWGQIPVTTGRVFWVSAGATYSANGQTYSASDDNDGLAPDRALRTVARAWALVAANVGDVIVLLPGTHTATATITANVAGVTMMGLPGGSGNAWRQRTSLTSTAAAALITLTVADVEIAYLNLIPVTAQRAISNTASSGLHVHHCYFDLNTPVASTSTIGLFSATSPSRMHIHDCVFDSDGAQGAGIALSTAKDSVVEDNLFSLSAGTWASAMTIATTADRLVVRRNTFSCAGTAITAGISGTGQTNANAVLIHDNRFSSLVTVPIDNFDATEAEISENYDAGVGAGDGGVLITGIT